MSLRAAQTLLLVLAVSLASVAAAPAQPSTPEQEPEANRSLPYAGTEQAATGECTETSTLLYVERVIVLKDNSTDHVNGTIEISIGSPVTIECVRVHAKTEHDQAALQGHRFEGQSILVTFAEPPASHSNGLEYAVYVYGTVGSKKNPLRLGR
uniref:Uncharacterized protein n=1 Tax=Anopheles epiroticus TaxID=199890 RepID=A0A182P2A3_9DIPT